MRIVILSSLTEATGNNTTCRRIQHFLQHDELHQVVLDDISKCDQWMMPDDRFDCALGIHAYRSGRFLVDGKVEFLLWKKLNYSI